MGGTKSFWLTSVLAIIGFLIKDTHNAPQSDIFNYSGKEFETFQPLTPDFLSQPSFFSKYGSSVFGRGQTPFVGYGPGYFYSIANIGPVLTYNQCPVIKTKCTRGKYRTFDGSCNNLRNPTWGAANTPYSRLVQPKYSDGVQKPAVSKSGQPLPSARALSVILYPDVKVDDYKWTLVTMQWGQLIAHDMSLASGTTLAEQRAGMCCGPDASTDGAINYKNGPQECYPIEIPKDDPVAEHFGQRCFTFSRSRTDQLLGCPTKFNYAEQITLTSHWIDASFVYGSDENTAKSLRTFTNGKLITELRGGREWPPDNVNRSMVCEGPAQKGIGSCYSTGDIRANQNIQLAVLQVLLLREHNRIATKLAHINPHWDDETLYQEARRILSAEVQHISYYEWLPILLGWKNLLDHGVVYDIKDAYINDYNDQVDPSILNEHATGSFRSFHTNIQGYISMKTENRFPHGSLRLSDHYNNPTVVEESTNFDDLTRGMSTQHQRATDLYHTSEVTDFLFRNRQTIGFDLKAVDIQRGRDHGIASYNDLRQFCGFPRAQSFEDFLDHIEVKNVRKLKQFYADPDDVDLVVGGLLEKLVPGTLSGPTNLCIMTEQFYRTRVADRFFYEKGGQESSFTPEQLTELRKASLSRLMCDNSDHIFSMQPRAFEKISGENPTAACSDFHKIPFVNLEAWRDNINIPNQPHYYTSHLLRK